MPPDVHLTSFYVGVLPGLPPCYMLAVIEGLGTRLKDHHLFPGQFSGNETLLHLQNIEVSVFWTFLVFSWHCIHVLRPLSMCGTGNQISDVSIRGIFSF